jgi:hypothetical protein
MAISASRTAITPGADAERGATQRAQQQSEQH